MPELKLVNSLIDGRYQIRERLGIGSYAEIYVARDLQEAGREVVIKALNTSLQGTPDSNLEYTLIENFQNEAVILDMVRHPNIILRLGHGTSEDRRRTPFHYIVLEYMPGGDLLRLARSRPGNALTLGEALLYFRQICDALNYAHARGIIHRDLKPNNFLMSEDNQLVKVADFGVAKTNIQESSYITRVGAEVYAPPEHSPDRTPSLKGRLTAATDIYSLAKSFYTVITGRAPSEYAAQPITSLPVSIRLQPWADDLLNVLRRATATVVSERHASVTEFWSDLAGLGSQAEIDDYSTHIASPEESDITRIPKTPIRPEFKLLINEEKKQDTPIPGGTINSGETESLQAGQVRHRLDRWKRRLIDLTKRNRLLNFKPTRVTTIRVIDELPTEVFRALQLDNRSMTFLPADDSGREKITLFDRGAPNDESDLGGAVEEADSSDFKRQDRAGIEARHTDTILQTNIPSERLEHNLLRIYQNATSLLEEQGVNSLFLSLGMIKWFESDDSSVELRAPLVLLPVELVRKSARSGFSLRATNEEPVLNPAIVEKLRLDFRISLPRLPEVYEDFDPEEYFEKVQRAVASRARWNITNDIYLGLFTFQKFVMFKDMEVNEKHYVGHTAIQSLCTGKGDRIHPLADEIISARLDEVLRPETTYQVLDADSSQQRAILAVSSGSDLVLEGPPGTGKSQTIANLIADALANGKSVLFVSEKMAALNVVHDRLETLGLHDFCLKLHGEETKKRTVIEELARVLNTPRPADHSDDLHLGRLAILREELNGYVNDLHTPFGKLAETPFKIFGEFARFDGAPVINVEVPGLADCDKQTFERNCRELSEHVAILREIEDPLKHLWRGSALRQISGSDRDLLEEEINKAYRSVEKLKEQADDYAGEIGSLVPETLGQVEVLCEVALSIAQSPKTSEMILRNERWNTISAEAGEILSRGKQFSTRRTDVLKHFNAELLDTDLKELLKRYRNHCQSWTRFFSAQFWRDRKTVRGYFITSYKPADNDQLLQDLALADSCRSDLVALMANDQAGQQLFGERWRGPESDWAELERFADWVVSVRKFVIEEALNSRGIELAASGRLDAEQTRAKVAELRGAVEDARKSLEKIITLGAFNTGSGLSSSPGERFTDVLSRLGELKAGMPKLRAWTVYQETLEKCRQGMAWKLLQRFYEEKLDFSLAEPAFRRLFYRRWLDLVSAERPRLEHFRALSHEKRIEEFQDLDTRALQLARQRVTHLLSRKRDLLVTDQQPAAELITVQRELRKRSRHMPLRQLLNRSPNAVRTIKPCFMMSPLSVAQFLDPSLHRFDLVVFDEASQIPPEDAVGAVMRGNQIVVVGDTKQLPPTNFFSAQITAADDIDLSKDEEPAITDEVESILDEFASVGFPRWRLKWHYRSQHESLISFSNREFYNNELLTFPSPVTNSGTDGLRFEWTGGIYEGKGINTIEARAVADAVCEHIRKHPDLSLGVGTFNIRQQMLILDELEKRRREDPSIEFFFARKGEDRFFVKNLENIQGDDRDIIFISVTYGPDAEGKIRYNFGPINGENGWRRLNVILTRAKQSLRIFSSMRGDQIDPSRAQAEGARLLREYLLFAERGAARAAVNAESEIESPFELMVYRELTRRGLRLVPQVGQSGYRIDFGVLDDQIENRFIAGLECDGATYHMAATARDRDRLMQSVLIDNLGWRLHRIWSTDWYHDQQGHIERILKLVEQSRSDTRREEEKRRLAGEQLKTGATSSVEGEEESRETVASEEVGGGESKQGNNDYGNAGTSPAEPCPLQLNRYVFAPVQLSGNPDYFFYEPESRIAELILGIARVEAPIHIAELARRVAACWQINRTSPRVRKRVEVVTQRLSLRGDIRLEGEFIWNKEQQSVAARSRAVDGYIFDADHISQAEYQAGVILVLSNSQPQMMNELVTSVARAMGFNRTGRKLSEHISQAIQKLVDDGKLRTVASGLAVVDSQQ